MKNGRSLIRVNKDISVADLLKEKENENENKKEKEIKQNEEKKEEIKEHTQESLKRQNLEGEKKIFEIKKEDLNNNNLKLSERVLNIDFSQKLLAPNSKTKSQELFFPCSENKNNLSSIEQSTLGDIEKSCQSWLKKYNTYIESNRNSEDVPEFSTFKFNNLIIEEINKLRTNCLAYSEKIEHYKNFIEFDKASKKKYLLKIHDLLYLPKEEKGFEECSENLRNIHKDTKAKKLEKLSYVYDLKFPFPENEEEIMDQNYIDENLKILEERFEGSYKVVNFFYFKSLSNPEICTMLQIIDQENDGNIRKILLSNSIRFIGVNYGKLKDGNYLVFLILANFS